MVGSSRESPGKRTAEKTSLFGLVSFQPHLAIVLIFLTLTLAVVGVRVSQDSGIRRVDDLVREAQRAFAAPQKEDAGARDPADVEARVREWTGARIILPRDEELFAYTGFSREKMGRQTVAAVRFTFSGAPYLLMVVRRGVIGGEEGGAEGGGGRLPLLGGTVPPHGRAAGDDRG